MVYRIRFAAFAAMALGFLIILGSAIAQTIPKSLQGGETEGLLRDHKNLWTVGLVGGLFFGFAFGFGGLGAALLGRVADGMGIDFVYQVCAFLPAIGLLGVFLPNLKKTAHA